MVLLLLLFFHHNHQTSTLSCSERKGSIVYQAPGWGQLCFGACSILSAACSFVCYHLFQSSLLSALLGELSLIKGNVNVHGRIAYVSQQPWVFPGTVRSNILFGKKYEEDRYKEVIKACALEKVNNDFWAAYTQFSNSDNVGLNSKVSWNFFLIWKVFYCCSIYLLVFRVNMQAYMLLF